MNEVENAVSLIRTVFLETEAKGITEKAVNSFLEMQTTEVYVKQLQSEGAVLLGAFLKPSELVGVLLADGFYLSHLYVKIRGKGVGKELLLFYEDILKKRLEGDGVITLNATLSAIPFYEALGFIVTDQIQEIYGISIVPMAKRIRKDIF
jgi:GNAT superfamily N-acetyltransferase